MLYEAIKERGSMVIVPSSVVENDGPQRYAGDGRARRSESRIGFKRVFQCRWLWHFLYSWNSELPLGTAAPTFIDR